MRNLLEHLAKYLGRTICWAMLGLLAAVLGPGAVLAQINAYVATTGASSVAVIDAATQTTLATVAGTGARTLAISADGTRVYSMNFNGFSVIDTATNTILATVATGFIPVGIGVTPGGTTGYVGNNASATVSVVDLTTYTVTTTLSSLPLSAIAITPNGASVWIALGSLSGASIAILDTATNTITTSFATGQGLNGAARMVFTKNGATAYVVNSNNTVSVIDTATLTTIAVVPVGPLPFSIALSPDEAFAGVANLTGNSVSIIDTATNTVIATVPVGAFPRDLAFTPDGLSLWVTNFNSNSISVIDTATWAVTSTFPVGSRPWGIVFTPSDSDGDGDGIPDGDDNCPDDANPDQADNDGDGAGDVCDPDDDDDGVLDGDDNCPFDANPDQADNDGDGAGDVCDPDDDNDGVLDGDDNCPLTANPDQADFDGDGLGDACDPDDDGDGVPDGNDICPSTPASQLVDPVSGCSIAQLCPCAGPRGSSMPWRNHGQYVSCVTQAATSFLQQGLITGAQKGAIVSAAARSSCGK